MHSTPLITDGKINVEAWACLTFRQKTKLLEHCLTEDRSVFCVLLEASFMVRQYGSDQVSVEGFLPWCGLYGCILPDGSTHT